MKPLRKKLQKCRDPDRANLVALQQARREQASIKTKKLGAPTEGILGTDAESRDAKRRKLEAADDVFGPALG